MMARSFGFGSVRIRSMTSCSTGFELLLSEILEMFRLSACVGPTK
jgi:hypothetical protein